MQPNGYYMMYIEQTMKNKFDTVRAAEKGLFANFSVKGQKDKKNYTNLL